MVYIQFSDDDGMTALYTASCNGHLEVVKYLATEAGADVNISDNQNTTPCDVAFSNGHIELARYLREACGASSGGNPTAVAALEESIQSLKHEILSLKRELGGRQRSYLFMLLAIAVVVLAYFNYSDR